MEEAKAKQEELEEARKKAEALKLEATIKVHFIINFLIFHCKNKIIVFDLHSTSKSLCRLKTKKKKKKLPTIR